jgi:hypothetical protein
MRRVEASAKGLCWLLVSPTVHLIQHIVMSGRALWRPSCTQIAVFVDSEFFTGSCSVFTSPCRPVYLNHLSTIERTKITFVIDDSHPFMSAS